MNKLAQPLTIVEVAFGSVGAAYGGTNLIVFASNDTRRCIKIIIRNDCDAAIYVTNDGVNNNYYLDPGEAIILDDVLSNNVQVKRFSGAPAAGSVRITPFLEL